MTADLAPTLITGVTGQDGVLLARLMRGLGRPVVGTHRPASPAAVAMAPYLDGVELVPLDLRDDAGFAALIDRIRPYAVVNLAAESSVGASWARPDLARAVNGEAPAAMLEVLRTRPDVRFLQAASSEEDGAAADSPYAQGKTMAHDAVRSARAEGRFAAAAVLHIHESPLRRTQFVARRISRAAAEFALGRTEPLKLGTLAVRRDWGAATDVVRALQLIVDADEPADHVVATGVVHSVRDVVELAFAAAGVRDPWAHVEVDAALVRPSDAPELVGDPMPLREKLGWEPRVTFEETVARMVRVDRLRLVSGVEESVDYLAPECAVSRLA